jgi:hypothetical protein
MDQASDFKGGLGIREAVEVVDPGGVLEAETVLTQQGGLERQASGVRAGQGPEVPDGERHGVPGSGIRDAWGRLPLGGCQLVEGGIGHVAERAVRIEGSDTLVGLARSGGVAGGDADVCENPPGVGVVGRKLYRDFQMGAGLGGAAQAEQETAPVDVDPAILRIDVESPGDSVEGVVGSVDMPQGHGQGDPGPRVVGVQVHQVFEDQDGPGELAQLIQGDAEVQEQVGGVGRSDPGQFQQLDTLPDLTALAEGDGGIHRLETRRDPAGRNGLQRGAWVHPHFRFLEFYFPQLFVDLPADESARTRR